MSRDTTVVAFRQPEAIDDPLSELAREGARRMLAQMLIAEADSFVAMWKDLKLPDGRDRVVRHGHGPHRTIQTGVGPVEVRRAKVRESAQSWRELLVDIKQRGLEIAPDLAVGDGALGFWKAIEEVFPGTRHQRCWVHKTANVLNKVALSVQVNMKADLRAIYGAPTRAAAEAAIDVFADKYGAKYDKAVACLTQDREALLAFFDFPAEHWDQLRTSSPIESVFATGRHRTVRTKGALSAKTAKLMVFKLVNAAAKTWRRLKGKNQLPKVVQGVKFQNGIEVITMPAHHAA